MWAAKDTCTYQGAYLWRTRWATVKFLDEQNLRDRVLTLEEFQRMVDAAPEYLKSMLICAFHTGMRRGEILGLTWDRVDFKVVFIRVKDRDTKTGEARGIPMGRELARSTCTFADRARCPRTARSLCVSASWPAYQVRAREYSRGYVRM